MSNITGKITALQMDTGELVHGVFQTAAKSWAND